MELIAVIILLLVAVAAMYAKMVTSDKKVKENEALERAIREQEEESRASDVKTLDGADIHSTVDFLNGLSDQSGQD